ncbi:TonB-dependent siderophore receptor [Marinibaculum pumilum]|uniref:TonB-dependent siderophore receptor n=1 Tax=Marinibaculum pumilum TaxID=1766165 RepID=A0ABV7L8M9_9PROT
MLLAGCAAPAAWAQSDSATTVAPEQAARAFAIPAQSLAAALRQFRAQSGLQLAYRTEDVRGVQSPGFTGSARPEDALQALLSGTGLRYDLSAPGTVTIARTTDRTGAIALDAVTVEGEGGAPAQALIGTKPAPFAGGQVARGGQVGMLGNRDFMDTPYSTTSYTVETIENQQALLVGDLMANDPSVRSDYGRARGSEEFTIRGLTVFNRDMSYNGLYGIAPFYTTPVASLERVEVLKGPNALLNGMSPYGSIGGTINVVPKRAGDTPLTRVTPMYISDAQVGGQVDVGRRFGRDKAFGVRVNGLYRNGDTPVENQSQENGNASVGMDYRGERVRLEADLSYAVNNTDAQQGLLFDFAFPVPTAPDSTSNFFQPWTYYDEQNVFGMVRGEVDILDNVTAYAAAGARRTDLDSLQTTWLLQNNAGLIASRPHYINAYDVTRSGELGIRGDFQTGGIRHEVTLSGSKYHEEYGQLSTRLTTIFSNLYEPVEVARPVLPSYGDIPKTAESDLTSFALADVLSVWGDRVQLTLGARRQQVGSTNFNGTTGAITSEYDKSRVTPTLGILVKPWQNVSLYGSYIEGLQQGPTAPNTAVNAGEVFPPFQSKQIEVGVKVDHGDIGATLSAFQITQPNGLTDPTTNVFGVDGEQRNRGIELNLFGEVTETVRLLGGVMYLDADLVQTQGGINDGNTAVAAPRFQGVMGAEWDTPFLHGLTLTGRGIYSSPQYLDAANTLELPQWVRFDIGARYRLTLGGNPVTIRANVENLLDNDYWASAARETLVQGAPRTFLVSTSFDF